MWPPVKLPTTEDTQEEESIFTVLKGELQPCHYIIRICFEAAMAVMYWSLTFLWAVFHQLGTKPRSGESLPWLSTARCLHRRLHMKIKRKKTPQDKYGSRNWCQCSWPSTSQPQYHSTTTVIFVLRCWAMFLRCVWDYSLLKHKDKMCFFFQSKSKK